MMSKITINPKYEFWIEIPDLIEQIKITVPGDSTEEAELNYRKFIQHIFDEAKDAMFPDKSKDPERVPDRFILDTSKGEPEPENLVKPKKSPTKPEKIQTK